MLSQAIQFLSTDPVVVVTGLLQVRPLVDRLVTTPTVPPEALIGSEEISQTLCRASKATDGSLAAADVPPATVVIPGRKPLVQLAPELVEVAKPMFAAPPPKIRPTWNAETMVEPKLNVSGSTSVRCWLVPLLYGSVLTRVSSTLACAGVAAASTRTAALSTGAADSAAGRRPSH